MVCRRNSTMLLALLGVTAGAAQLPNFVILLADDVGHGDVGYACKNATICPRTPNIDAMANSAHSIVFDRFYAGSGVCSPTRATVLTGRTNKRSCISGALNCDHVNPAWSCQMGSGIARTEFSIAHAAAARGYKTQHLGKWVRRAIARSSLASFR